MATRRNANSVAGKPGLDPTLPDVSIILGGKTRQLCFDFNAICVAEKATGLNLLRAVVRDVDAASVRALLWAAMLRDEPELTMDEVGAMIRPASVPGIRAALLEAWFGSVDDGEEKAGATGERKAQTKRV